MINKDKVYELLTKIPGGKVSTYKILAMAAGTKSSRAIGQILKRNPNAPIVPCHRIVKSNGDLGGYNGTETERKIELLKSEGILIENKRIQNLKDIIFDEF